MRSLSRAKRSGGSLDAQFSGSPMPFSTFVSANRCVSQVLSMYGSYSPAFAADELLVGDGRAGAGNRRQQGESREVDGQVRGEVLRISAFVPRLRHVWLEARQLQVRSEEH